MLQVIRDRAQGVFAWIIVGLISIPFALWGINSYFGGGGDASIAEVDGVPISQRQLQSAYQQQRDRLQQMFGGELPEGVFSEERMKAQILQQLIEREVLIAASIDQGMRIGNGQLADVITSIDAFYVDGKFNNEEYERVLARQGMSSRGFEMRVRRDLLASQLTDAVLASEFTLDTEVDTFLQLQNQQRDIAYMILPVSRYEGETVVEADELQTYYESNSARYMQPEQVKVSYLELKADDLAAEVTVDSTEMRQRYEAQILNYRTPEERRASHILITATGEDATARKKAEALLARINAGEDFATIAKEESQDPGSAKKGGDLGFFGHGVMDKAFEDATFALQQGAVSGVVRSAFGYHIIKLVDVRGGETKSYEQVEAQLKREIQNEIAAERFYDLAEQLANLTYEQPDTLTIAAEQLSLPIKQSDMFTRAGGEGIAAESKIVASAFSEDVLVRGNNSETIELNDNHLVVVRVQEHQPETLRPFDEVKGEIEASLKRDKAREKALSVASELYARLQSGEEGSAVAKSAALEWTQHNGITRDNRDVAPGIVQVAFRMPHPAEGKSSSEKLSLPGGDQALVVVSAVKATEPSLVDAASRGQAKERLARANSNAAEIYLVDGLRKRADISIKQ